ncbi:hypothetical protein QQF64_034195 [Cirrhinus molitorella]|uniref:Uncharacterized protein n=1 Tax=Cirrhinus molitorella TaxID=172907 RepID=A0ABR3MW21_9TELE
MWLLAVAILRVTPSHQQSCSLQLCLVRAVGIASRDLHLDELGLKDVALAEICDYCGEAKGFCHRIRLTDDRPFRLPYRRLSPAHYHKLKQTLDEMEQKEIIRKSSSEFASPYSKSDLESL